MACLVLSVFLHGLGALLVIPVPVSPGIAISPPRLTVVLESPKPSQREQKAKPEVMPAKDPLFPLPAPIAVEVPQSVASAVDPLKFYPGSELDQGAEPAADVELRFPRLPPGSPRKSKVVIELRINEEGRVVDAAVIESSHPGLWDEQALLPFRNLAFVPARLNGLAVKSVKRIEVGYEEYRDRGDSKIR